MSRVGKKPIEVPSGVEVKLDGSVLRVKGPKGELTLEVHPQVNIGIGSEAVTVTVKKPEDIKQSALWGLFRNLVNNMVIGVTKGFEKKLEVNGVGYKVSLQGQELKLDVGFSHEVNFSVPEGIDVTVEKNVITVSGTDKQLVGETAARIRRIRKPEPYKGKGVRYSDEHVARKEAKKK